MKIELQNTDGYSTYAYLEQASHPEGFYSMKITSVWDKAKNPDDEQVRFKMLLNPEALENLRKLFK